MSFFSDTVRNYQSGTKEVKMSSRTASGAAGYMKQHMGMTCRKGGQHQPWIIDTILKFLLGLWLCFTTELPD
jgi:hypothetical protein